MIKLSRFIWLVVAGLTVVSLAASIPMGYDRLVTPCSGEACFGDQVAPEAAARLAQGGISLHFYALANIGLTLVFALVFGAVAALIFWRRSNDRVAFFASLTLLIFGVFNTEFIYGLALAGPGWTLLVDIMSSLGWITLGIFLCVFPDGRFIPSWTRFVALGWVFTQLPYYVALLWPHPAVVAVNPGNWPEVVQLPLYMALFGGGALAQIYRYRRVANAVQKQQTRWVLFGLLTAILAMIGLNLMPGIVAPEALTEGTPSKFLIDILSALAFMLVPVSLGAAILRYQLWDIDVIIRKALVYTTLTALLALFYFGGVLLLQQVFRSLTGQTSVLAIVLSTLFIAALFQPLRRRVQEVIDRRFYRRKYDAAQALAAFAATARDEVALERLTAELSRLVQETVQPEHVSVWLRQTVEEERPPMLNRR